ncbi:DUF907 domain-containing protein [Pseudovirgaria hyperparasitica]|uniref:DUF907 domain-containing protein n=1 Tax=Pseudovirgaria hyperparasitica TaxID=470096 RepID=A0A6A6VSU8_9PEZI|nr:DUF907 domain-containing protein [Pseudovirgaria hyperparasitica]KAF2753662.1 DUF907 domain-containing protein [Pseudovirgaria hyperparasitica]
MRITVSSLLGSTLLLASTAVADDVLRTEGFSNCAANTDVSVQKVNIEYSKGANVVNFDVAGTSLKEQKVTGTIIVTAYGKEVYKKDFDPCDEANKVDQMCPIPQGHFSASGIQSIPEEYLNKIPAIAFTVPNLDGMATLELKTKDSGEILSCIQSTVNNGKSFDVAAVSYVTAGMAGAALVLSGLTALGAAGNPGTPTPSPTFGETMGWFQGIALNGMMSVKYPQVYQSFSRNFAFSSGLVTWDGLQTSIDNFRAKTGGNLTEDSVAYLRNSTLVYTKNTVSKRSLDSLSLFGRDDLQVGSDNNTDAGAQESEGKNQHLVANIQGYVEALTIPQANTFMTILLVFACVVGAIIVGILLFKVILETWALFGTFPKGLTGFRKRYWWLVAKTITNLILILYGVWVLYCVYQFTNGDSWAAKTLAGVTLAMFTAVLGFFTFRIYQLANKYKRSEGDVSGLYENKDTWIKYSLFYDSYKKSYWWIFVPAIIYMFAKGCVIAGANGHGLVQTGGQIIIESLLLGLLLWSRPYTLKSGNWINIFIQVVRVLSVVCILVFVEELGLSQTTQTVTGVVLIVVQSTLTGALAILIAVNAIIMCCKDNPHRKKRKEAGIIEKLNRDLDNLTPLDARNSLLMDTTEYKGHDDSRHPMVSAAPLNHNGYDSVDHLDTSYRDHDHDRHTRNPSETRRGLLDEAASFGGRGSHRSISPPATRVPRLPDIEMGPPQGGFRGQAY